MIGWFDGGAGASGDMLLGAFVGAGVPLEVLSASIRALDLGVTLRSEQVQRAGLDATRIHVEVPDSTVVRHLPDILALFGQLNAGVRTVATAVFERLAEAEARVHGTSIDEVHFHEVGALDSIADIVGAAAAIEYLQPDIVLCDAVEVGSGFVNCAHGQLPVPAPATQEVLHGVPCRYGTVDGEATTPTGAAILAGTVAEFLPKGVFTPTAIGYGVGRKDFTIPNVLRVALGTYENAASAQLSQRFTDLETGHYQIEANIDDMSPEAYGPLMDALFSAGAVDVFTQPILMKKQRPAQCLTALCQDAELKAVTDTLLNASTSIGLRILPFTKRVLARQQRIVTTRLGNVAVKFTQQPDGRERFKVEHADIVRLAAEHALDYLSAQRMINEDAAKASGHSA